MILCDVGVLLNAMIEGAAHHRVCRREFEAVRSRPGELALSERILAAVVRIGRNPKAFRAWTALAPAVLAAIDRTMTREL